MKNYNYSLILIFDFLTFNFLLPTAFGHSRYQTFIRRLAETDTA